MDAICCFLQCQTFWHRAHGAPYEAAVGALWDSYLSFGGGNNLLIRILVQTDKLRLLHRMLGPWASVQEPGPALEGRALWNNPKTIISHWSRQLNPAQCTADSWDMLQNSTLSVTHVNATLNNNLTWKYKETHSHILQVLLKDPIHTCIKT